MSSDSETDYIETAIHILKRKRQEKNKKYKQKSKKHNTALIESASAVTAQDDLSDFSDFSDIDFSDIEYDESDVDESIGMLYDESITSYSEFLCSLYAIQIKHKLGDSVLNDILFLIRSVLPQPNKCPKSVKGFSKLLPKKSLSHFHECCMICQEIKKTDSIKTTNFQINLNVIGVIIKHLFLFLSMFENS